MIFFSCHFNAADGVIIPFLFFIYIYNETNLKKTQSIYLKYTFLHFSFFYISSKSTLFLLCFDLRRVLSCTWEGVNEPETILNSEVGSLSLLHVHLHNMISGYTSHTMYTAILQNIIGRKQRLNVLFTLILLLHWRNCSLIKLHALTDVLGLARLTYYVN